MITKKEANKIFKEKNDAGEGFAVGQEMDEVNSLEGLGELVDASSGDWDLAVYLDGDNYTLIGDVHGPWAVSHTE